MTAIDLATPTRRSSSDSRLRHRRRRSVLGLLYRDRTAMVGAIIIVLLVVSVVLAPIIARHDPYDVDVNRHFASPSRAFPLGTDQLGRDVFSRVVYGGRTSLLTGLEAAVLIGVIGTMIGVACGYARGATDMILSRLIEVVLSVPSFLLALAVVAVLGPGLRNVVVAMAISWWAGFARLVRASVLTEHERGYVEGARAVGASHSRIVVIHLLPNILGSAIVLMALEMAGILLGVAAFSFLGLAVKPPTAEWGAMLSDARSYASVAPYLMVAPGMAIFLTVLGLNLLADGMRDLLDPRTRAGASAALIGGPVGRRDPSFLLRAYRRSFANGDHADIDLVSRLAQRRRAPRQVIRLLQGGSHGPRRPTWVFPRRLPSACCRGQEGPHHPNSLLPRLDDG